MQIVNKGVHRKQETRIHQISLLMKYSFANEGQILDSYAFEGISKIVMEFHDPLWQSSVVDHKDRLLIYGLNRTLFGAII